MSKKRLIDNHLYVKTLDTNRTMVVDPQIIIDINLTELIAIGKQAQKSNIRWKRKNMSQSFFIHLNKNTSFFINGAK